MGYYWRQLCELHEAPGGLINHKTNKKIKPLSPEFIEALKQHSWEGNIRELKNVIERSVILSNNNELTTDTLPAKMQNVSSLTQTSKQLSAFDLASVEKQHIQKVLNYTNGNKSEAARLLGIGAATLYRKIEEYKLWKMKRINSAKHRFLRLFMPWIFSLLNLLVILIMK